jgi:two-component system, chemotaxis family, chemotaxis protein CheY
LLALVVDDSRVARSRLKRTLSSRGFQVVEADNGRSALELLATIDAPCVALVDWNMPVMNGLEFVKNVRDSDRYQDMILMMVTSESEPKQMVRALHAGADEYLMKPYTAELLFEKLTLLGVGEYD